MYFVKLPLGEWVNLALAQTVEVEELVDSPAPDIDRLIVRLVFVTGKSKTYSGASSVAILEALTETPYIDKSHLTA